MDKPKPHYQRLMDEAKAVSCPHCWVAEGIPCEVASFVPAKRPHKARLTAARAIRNPNQNTEEKAS